jgi:hypothetical protein
VREGVSGRSERTGTAGINSSSSRAAEQQVID